MLDAAAGGFPDKIPSTYTCFEGEVDVSARIMLGGKGQHATYTDGIARDATHNWDDPDGRLGQLRLLGGRWQVQARRRGHGPDQR